jgi:hypothetical protein
MNNKQQYVLTDNFELSDNRLLRQLRHWRRTKTLTAGNNEINPELTCFATLFAYHKFGRPLFYLQGWLGRQKEFVKSVFRHKLNHPD